MPRSKISRGFGPPQSTKLGLHSPPKPRLRFFRACAESRSFQGFWEVFAHAQRAGVSRASGRFLRMRREQKFPEVFLRMRRKVSRDLGPSGRISR